MILEAIQAKKVKWGMKLQLKSHVSAYYSRQDIRIGQKRSRVLSALKANSFLLNLFYSSFSDVSSGLKCEFDLIVKTRQNKVWFHATDHANRNQSKWSFPKQHKSDKSGIFVQN